MAHILFLMPILSYILDQTGHAHLGRHDFVLMVNATLTHNCKIWFVVRGLNGKHAVQ